MIKYAFFDIDGTLCVPRYLYEGIYEPAFTDEGWKNFCNSNGDRIYDNVFVVKPTRRYAESLHAQGVKLYVLSTVHYENEILSKEKFIREKFPGLFDEVICVENDMKKLDVILDFARAKNISPSECELVEDTYFTLLKAYDKGISIKHISALIWDL